VIYRDSSGHHISVSEARDHNDAGVGRPDAGPQADVGDGHLGDSHLGTFSTGILRNKIKKSSVLSKLPFFLLIHCF
jgi:hypothetical protein